MLHDCYMITSSKIIRIRLDTYNRLRKCFKSKYGESVAEYFERVAKYIEELHDEHYLLE